MSTFRRVLCPVDLSENSQAAIPLATTIAKQSDSKLIFLFVSPQWLPQDSMFGSEYIQDVLESEKKQLKKIRPSDPDVGFEHVFRHGNAGPEIVRESKACDTIVMSTHGYGAMMRLLMGSVAQYVLRNAQCPVVMVRNPRIQKVKEGDGKQSSDSSGRFVTEVMRQVSPIQEDDNIDQVLADLDKANETGAPVTNELGECIGILTKTDIDKYRGLKERYDQKDLSVVGEMFETDEFGLRRPVNIEFDTVKRHMSSPVIMISNTETTEKACDVFAADQTIHHLVVVDDEQRALGIVEPSDCHSVKANETSDSVE